MLRLFFITLLLFSLPAWAQEENACSPYESPTFTFEAIGSAPHIDTSRQLGYLVVMASKNSPNFSSTGHEFPVGLTEATLTLQASYKMRLRQIAGTNQYCAQITAFHLRYGFPKTTVFLARELPSMSCGFKAVLAHELQHVAIDKAFTESLKTPLEGAMGDLARDIGVVRTAAPEEAKNFIRRTVDAKIESLGKELAAVRQRQQLRIDTKDEYSRLSETCNGELAELIGQYTP